MADRCKWSVVANEVIFNAMSARFLGADWFWANTTSPNSVNSCVVGNFCQAVKGNKSPLAGSGNLTLYFLLVAMYCIVFLTLPRGLVCQIIGAVFFSANEVETQLRSNYRGEILNAYITFFLVFGACFGIATFSYRHLFSEGPHQAEDSLQTPSLGSRIFWILVCTFLWPIMLLTGVNTAWVLTKRKRQLQ